MGVEAPRAAAVAATDAPTAATSEPTEAERWAAFEERQRQYMFVNEHGGWTRVEGYRLRKGPKDGEVWLSYDEMIEVKKQQEAGAGGD